MEYHILNRGGHCTVEGPRQIFDGGNRGGRGK